MRYNESALKARPELLGAVMTFIAPDAYISDHLFTPTPVEEIVGFQDRIPIGSIVPRSQSNPGAPGTSGRRSQADVTPAQFRCVVEKLDAEISREKQVIWRDRFDMHSFEAKRLATWLLTNRDVRVVNQFINRTYLPQDGVQGSLSSAVWTNAGSADARRDASAVQNTGLTRFGGTYTKVVMAEKTWRDMWLQTSFRNAYSGIVVVGAPQPNDEQAKKWVADQFGVEEVAVVKTVVNAAGDGVTPSIARVFPTDFVVFLRPCGDKTDPTPGFGRCLHFDELGGLMDVQTFEEPDPDLEVVRVRECIQHFEQTKECIHLLGVNGT